MVRAHSSRRSSTSGAERYSSGRRSKARASASVPRSRAASSYSARACPISFCAIDEKATSSSRKGAIPVHSESRHPRTSSSSASSRSSSFTGKLQLLLQRVAVDAVVVALELVDEVVDGEDGVAGDDPERLRLGAPPVELTGVLLGEAAVGSLQRACVRERLALPLLPEDLPDHAASASTTRRTHSVSSRVVRRKPNRSSVIGPCPVTTHLSSSQSGSVY